MSKNVETVLKNYPNAGRDSLIPILQDVQEADGYISKEAVEKVGDYLNLPASKIFGVATFYNQFRFSPIGKYHIQICRGTACHVKGSGNILEEFQRQLSIKPGDTSRDGLFSLEVVACIGACGLAPAITINGEVFAKVTRDEVKKIVKKYQKEVSKDV
ncbi:MAG: NADH-quinone oxidoreductase subunit NuoE [Candidatus Marinimicrobia bacterium]|nr:NADH-quinone oxidoreductase subunit NuoE [Candidatus Neomarinimicrobiota bacterium]